MRGSSRGRHGSGTHVVNNRSIFCYSAGRDNSGRTNFSHTAFKIFQIQNTGLGFPAATGNQLCSLLDEQRGGKKKPKHHRTNKQKGRIPFSNSWWTEQSFKATNGITDLKWQSTTSTTLLISIIAHNNSQFKSWKQIILSTTLLWRN